MEHRSAPDRFPRTATFVASSRRFREMNRGIARRRRRSRWLLAAGVTAIAAAGFVAIRAALGGRATGARLQRMRKSPEWQGSHFENPQPIVNDMWGAVASLLRPDAQREASVSAEDRSGRSRALRGVPILGAAGDLARPLDRSARDRRPSLPHRSRLERAGRRRPRFAGPRRWFRPPLPLARPATPRRRVALARPLRSPRLCDDRRAQGPQPRSSSLRSAWARTSKLGRSGGADRRARLVGLARLSGTRARLGTPARHASGAPARRQRRDALGGLRAARRRAIGVYYSGDTGLFPAHARRSASGSARSISR